MSSTAYYNEHDPEKAEVLRRLMRDGWIAPGDVDQRDIRDVTPDQLSGYSQCHFFAGIGLWSVAARRAGIPDDFRFWSGSCPCQPFSTAGAGEGTADDRHLWPFWYWLVAQCRPDAVVGEQVASKDGLAWFDLVSADMEGSDYAGGALDLCSAGFGSPNIRQRFFMCWLADSGGARREWGRVSRPGESDSAGGVGSLERLAGLCADDWVVNSIGEGLEGFAGHGDHGGKPGRERADEVGPVTTAGDDDRLGHSCSQSSERHAGTISSPQAQGAGSRDSDGRHNHRHSDAGQIVGLDHAASARHQPARGGKPEQSGSGECLSGLGCEIGDALGMAHTNRPLPQDGNIQRGGQFGGSGGDPGTCTGDDPPSAERSLRDPLQGPANGFWAGADWLLCRDPDGPKLRPVRPGAFCLAPGYPGRNGELRAYGDAINLEVATAWLEAVKPDLMDSAA